MKITSFLRLIRTPNLFIVALTQYLLQYYILIPELNRLHLSPLLSNFHFFLLVISTVLIAAGGYIINDIEDVEIDKLNKPLKKQIVGRIYPLSISRQMYVISTFIGFVISLYLAFYINNLAQIIIYPAAVGMLYAYSKWWKRQPLIGNIVIAFFCAFVAWVVFYAEKLNFTSDKLRLTASDSPLVRGGSTYDFLVLIFVGYALFAFVSTLYREIIKDIEDAEGDKVGNCRTLPIVIGTSKSKYWAFAVGLVFLGLLLYGNMMLYKSMHSNTLQSFLPIILLNGSITLPVLYAQFLVLKAERKEDYSFLSKFAKFIMLSGLMYIIIMKL